MSDKKDWWDKGEIIGKILLPVVIAAATLIFNWQVNQRQRDATMLDIAVGILSTEAPEQQQTDPLKAWAVDRLAEQGSFDSETLASLRDGGLPIQQLSRDIRVLEIQAAHMERSYKGQLCAAANQEADDLRGLIPLQSSIMQAAEAGATDLPMVTQTDIARNQSRLAEVLSLLAGPCLQFDADGRDVLITEDNVFDILIAPRLRTQGALSPPDFSDFDLDLPEPVDAQDRQEPPE